MPDNKRTLLALLMAGTALVTATGAIAAENTETVIVTGSRIPTASNATSPSPISVVNAEQIAHTGSFSLGDVLTKMTGPDATNGATSASNNGSYGLSQVGLRNLGPARTVVLVDGQRLIPVFSSANSIIASIVDLNTVPIAMIDRLEVLRDGASSIYGADAIGGVINIITKKDFEGFHADAHIGAGMIRADAFNYGVSGMFGANIGSRGNITASLVHEMQDPVTQASRGWAVDPHLNQPGVEGGSAFRTQLNLIQAENASTDGRGQAVWNNDPTDPDYDPTFPTETTNTDPSLGKVPCLQYLPHTKIVKLNAACGDIHPGQTLTTGQTRTQAALNGHYDILPNVTFVASGFYTHKEAENRLRPEPLLGDTIAGSNPVNGTPVFGGFLVPASWPGFVDYLGLTTLTYGDPTTDHYGVGCRDPQGCLPALLTPNQFGARTYKEASDTYRVNVGLKGTVDDRYNWEAGYVLQHNDTVGRVYNTGNFQHLSQATGLVACQDVPGGCTYSPDFGMPIPTTPFNFFGGVNTFTPEQVNYLTYTMVDHNSTDQNFIYLDANGPLFDLPAGPLEGSIGFENRSEKVSDNPDALMQAGYAPNATAATSGGYNVTSFYGELRIPAFKNTMLGELDLTPSARYDHYSAFGDSTTWKVGADWQVIDDLRFRGTYATGFRAPSTGELYGGGAVSYVQAGGDPCDARAPGYNGNVNAGTGSLAPGSACYADLTKLGLTPAQIAIYNSPENNITANQVTTSIGGNTKLMPEQSHSWNIGTVITPTFAAGLSLDVDYYNITISNVILSGGITSISGMNPVITGCYVDQRPEFCALITRNAGGISGVGSRAANFGRAHAEGLDLEATYSTDQAGIILPVPGTFNFDLQLSRQFTYTVDSPDGRTIHNTGHFNYNNEAVMPDWKGMLTVDWNLDSWGIHWSTQYTGGTTNSEASYGPAVYGNEIPEIFYHNLSISYDFDGFFGDQTIGKHTGVIVGVDNLFDKSPPFLSADSANKSNTIGGPYDVIGRAFYIRLATDF